MKSGLILAVILVSILFISGCSHAEKVVVEVEEEKVTEEAMVEDAMKDSKEGEVMEDSMEADTEEKEGEAMEDATSVITINSGFIENTYNILGEEHTLSANIYTDIISLTIDGEKISEPLSEGDSFSHESSGFTISVNEILSSVSVPDRVELEFSK